MVSTHVTRLQTKAEHAVHLWRTAPHGHKTAARKASDRAVAKALRAETKAMRRIST